MRERCVHHAAQENPDTGAGLYARAEICIAYTVVQACAGGEIEVGFNLEMAKAEQGSAPARAIFGTTRTSAPPK